MSTASAKHCGGRKKITHDWNDAYRAPKEKKNNELTLKSNKPKLAWRSRK